MVYRNRGLKSKLLAQLQKGPMTKDEIIKGLGITSKQFYNLMYVVKRANVNIKLDGGQYSIPLNTGIVPAIVQFKPSPTMKKWDELSLAKKLSVISPDQIETTMDLLHKAYFYEAALEAQLKASSLVSTVRSMICGQVH